MSVAGHSRPNLAVRAMSGLPPAATVGADIPARQLRANNGSRHQESTNAIGHSRSPASRSPSKRVLHISPADEIFAAALMTTTVVRTLPALGSAAAVWLAATKASAPAYASGWQ